MERDWGVTVSPFESFNGLSGRGDFAENAAFHADHDQRRVVQDGIARSAGITHRDTAIPEVDGGTQGRADAHLGGNAGYDECFNPVLGQHLL